jgi:hypothetical protein
MPCYHPIRGYRSKNVRPDTGKAPVVFGTGGWANPSDPVAVPCGQCIGCRLEKSRQWAIRIMHEASQWEDNSFITLTYDEDHLPSDGSLNKSHFQKFMKRLRKKYPSKTIRFYHCGEYGEQNFRPHYHAAIFNYCPDDKKLDQGFDNPNLYSSRELELLWPYGYNTVGELTFDSAAYIARYVTKKITGEKAKEHYSRVNPDSGEYHSVLPEYATMSRRPGIGRDWYDKYNGETYDNDSVIMRGMEMKPPKYYDNLLEQHQPLKFEEVKKQRLKERSKYMNEQLPERLEVREKVKTAKHNLNKRKL